MNIAAKEVVSILPGQWEDIVNIRRSHAADPLKGDVIDRAWIFKVLK